MSKTNKERAVRDSQSGQSAKRLADGLAAEFAEMLASQPDAPPAAHDVFDKLIEEELHLAPLPPGEGSGVRGGDDRLSPHPQPLSRGERGDAGASGEDDNSGQHAAVITDERLLSSQILEQIEKYNLAAVSQLRIEVHAGAVVIAGEVPSDYEKQLIGHFCQRIPGVTKFIDGMVVRDPENARHRSTSRSNQRQTWSRIEWRLPFRAWHAGAALGLVVLVWGAISLGRSGHERQTVHPLSGTLFFEGQPAAGASIVLYPTDPSIAVRPRASVNDDGTFELTSYEPGDGAPEGDYRATIEWRRPVPGHEAGDEAPAPNVLPSAYGNASTTPVTVAVGPGENEFPAITFQK